MSRKFIYEFLFRGSDPEDSESQSAWHIIVREVTDDGLGHIGDTMYNISQTADAGIALPNILGDLNLQMAVALESIGEKLAPSDDLEADEVCMSELREAIAEAKILALNVPVQKQNFWSSLFK